MTAWTVVRPSEEPTSRDKSEEPFIYPAAMELEDDLPPTLTFDVNEDGKVAGFGLQGIWGAGEGVRSPTGDSVRDRSEVWFERSGQESEGKS